MNKSVLLGIIILSYGFSAAVVAAERATLTLSGGVVVPGCSAEVIHSQLHQRCGNQLRVTSIKEPLSSPVKGVTTEIVTLANSSQRKIILTRYD